VEKTNAIGIKATAGRCGGTYAQWGGWGVDGKNRAKKQNGRLLQGRTWDAVPEPVIAPHMQS